MRRIHRQLVGQGQDLVAQRVEQLAGEIVAWSGAEQIGAADGTDHQRPTREQRRRVAVLDDEKGEVIGGVTRSGDRPQDHAVGELDLLTRMHPAVGDLEAGRRRGEEDGAVGGQFRAAGDVVGVGMGVGCPGDPPSPLRGQLPLGGGKPGGVNHQRRAVSERDEMGRVSETLIDDGVHVHGHHLIA